MAAKLVEGEAGDLPILKDVVEDDARRATFRDLIHDCIERAAVRGIRGAYSEVMKAHPSSP